MAKKRKPSRASKEKPAAPKTEKAPASSKPKAPATRATPQIANDGAMGLRNVLIVDIDFFDAQNSQLVVRLTRQDGSVTEQKIIVSGKLVFDNASKGDAITVDGVCPGSGELRTNRKTDPESSDEKPRKYTGPVVDLLSIES